MILLITALLLSATATYTTIIKIDEAPVIGQPGGGNVGVHVMPVRNTNVGLTIIPIEEKEEK